MTFCALIVDDDAAARFIYQHVLSSLGFQVTTAENGAAALEYLRSNFYHLILLDLLLPIVSGQDLLRYIHHADHLRAARVVVVSAQSKYSDPALGTTEATYLVKPVTPRALRELASQIVAIHST